MQQRARSAEFAAVTRYLLPSMVFLTALGTGLWALPQLELRGPGYPGRFLIHEDAEPGENAFFVTRGAHELSHLVLYHGIGSSIEHARDADILIIGNSRAQLGFSEKVLVREAAALGLRVFNLSVGHAESAEFARLLIARHDLRPRMVIANGGDFFYGRRLSDWAREVVAMSRWQALKAYFEYCAGWELERRLHSRVPHLDYFQNWRYPWIHYRSRETGWWRNTREPESRYPIRAGEDAERYPHRLPVARTLQRELAERGALLVATIVPYRLVTTGHLPYFYRELGIPFALPAFDGLETADGSHLSPASARRATRELWRDLLAYPEVRQQLSAATLR